MVSNKYAWPNSTDRRDIKEDRQGKSRHGSCVPEAIPDEK